MRWIRHLKLSWVIGLAVLTASLLGAHYYQQPRQGDSPNSAAPAANGQKGSHAPRGGGVVCSGIIAPENEIIPLFPSQVGEVAEVFVKSEQHVHKGDKLLRLDDKLAKSKLDEAEAGVEAAEGLLVEAEIALKSFELEKLAMDNGIKAKEKMREAAQDELADAKEMASVDSKSALKFKSSPGQKKIDALELEIKVERIKLEIVELRKPTAKVTQAKAGVKRAKALRDQAQIGVDACLLTAPEEGTIMQVFAGVGSKFGPQIQKPAFLFYSGDLMVRADIDQEWVGRVSPGQTAVIEDYSNPDVKWTGKVSFVASQFLPKRDTSAIPEFMQQNQERVMECRVTLDEGQPRRFLNQKVRVHIGSN